MAQHNDDGELLTYTPQEFASQISAHVLAVTSILITAGIVTEDDFNKVLALCKHKVDQELTRKRELLRKANPGVQLFHDLFGGE